MGVAQIELSQNRFIVLRVIRKKVSSYFNPGSYTLTYKVVFFRANQNLD